jgi:hypothetical protein
MTGNAKPLAPAPSVRVPPPAARYAREETPLRSVDEFVDPAALGEDTEFAFMEGESFFDDFDESVLGARATGDV